MKAHAFIPPTMAVILRLLYSDEKRAWAQRELERKLKLPRTTLRRELRRLCECDVIAVEIAGQRRLYSVNVRSPIHDEVRSIVHKTYGVVEAIRECLLPFPKDIEWAFIRNQGNVTGSSTEPIVLHVIGHVEYDAVHATVRKLAKKLGRPIHIEPGSFEFFKQNVRLREPRSMFAVLCKKIWLYGDPDALNALAKERPRQLDRITLKSGP